MAGCIICVCFSAALQTHNSTSDNGRGIIAITQMLFGWMPLFILLPKHLIFTTSHIVIQVGRSRISEAQLFFQDTLLKMTVSMVFLGKKIKTLWRKTRSLFTKYWLNWSSVIHIKNYQITIKYDNADLYLLI